MPYTSQGESAIPTIRSVILPSSQVGELLRYISREHEEGYYSSGAHLCPSCQRGKLEISCEGPLSFIYCTADLPCPRGNLHHSLYKTGARFLGMFPDRSEELMVAAYSEFASRFGGSRHTPIVENLIPARSLLLISGKPKSGKSLLAMDMLDSISNGMPVFGAFEVKSPGIGIYLMSDN